MGLEATKRECFLSQLGKCDGACVGLEIAESYNERFNQAFGRQQVASWPYSGPVLVKESHPQLEGEAGYVVDNWCVKAVASDDGFGTVDVQEQAGDFDLDRYKIIRKFLDNPRNQRQIVRISASQYQQFASQSF